MSKEIPLHGKYGKGKVAIVDNADYRSISQYRWYFINNYVVTRIQRNCIITNMRLHRIILGVTDERQVDHINNDTLDNRRSNLRPCTGSQNQRNRRKLKPGSSKFKGVYWHKRQAAWRAHIRVDRKMICIGNYTDEIIAAKAYDRAAHHYFGEFAKLNFLELDNTIACYLPNPEKIKSAQSSRFRGVHWNDQTKKWVARTYYQNQPHYLGYFADETEAAKAYDLKAIELHGRWAITNFPPESYAATP